MKEWGNLSCQYLKEPLTKHVVVNIPLIYMISPGALESQSIQGPLSDTGRKVKRGLVNLLLDS